jgi:hypothetical protein
VDALTANLPQSSPSSSAISLSLGPSSSPPLSSYVRGRSQLHGFTTSNGRRLSQSSQASLTAAMEAAAASGTGAPHPPRSPSPPPPAGLSTVTTHTSGNNTPSFATPMPNASPTAASASSPTVTTPTPINSSSAASVFAHVPGYLAARRRGSISPPRPSSMLSNAAAALSTRTNTTSSSTNHSPPVSPIKKNTLPGRRRTLPSMITPMPTILTQAPLATDSISFSFNSVTTPMMMTTPPITVIPNASPHRAPRDPLISSTSYMTPNASSSNVTVLPPMSPNSIHASSSSTSSSGSNSGPVTREPSPSRLSFGADSPPPLVSIGSSGSNNNNSNSAIAPLSSIGRRRADSHDGPRVPYPSPPLHPGVGSSTNNNNNIISPSMPYRHLPALSITTASGSQVLPSRRSRRVSVDQPSTGQGGSNTNANSNPNQGEVSSPTPLIPPPLSTLRASSLSSPGAIISPTHSPPDSGATSPAHPLTNASGNASNSGANGGTSPAQSTVMTDNSSLVTYSRVQALPPPARGEAVRATSPPRPAPFVPQISDENGLSVITSSSYLRSPPLGPSVPVSMPLSPLSSGASLNNSSSSAIALAIGANGLNLSVNPRASGTRRGRLLVNTTPPRSPHGDAIAAAAATTATTTAHHHHHLSHQSSMSTLLSGPHASPTNNNPS